MARARSGYRRAADRARALAAIIERDGDGCSYCGCELSTSGKRARTIDHVVPISQGGTRAVDNLRLACFACNKLKRDLPVDRHLASRALAHRRAVLAREQQAMA